MRNVLLALLSLIILSFAFQAQAREPPTETAYGSNVFRNKGINHLSVKSIPEALDAIITPIIEPSVFEDCMEHPEKYDIYDGVKTVETAPCFSNMCWTKQIIIHGVSMQPTIYDGSIITVRHDVRYNLSIGKIIAFDSLGQSGGQYSYNIIHRIVGIEPKNATKLIRNEMGYNIVVPVLGGGATYYSVESKRFLTNISETLYVVKGDGNMGCELIPENAVHGVVVGI